MIVAHCVSSVDLGASGIDYCVPALCGALQQQDLEVHLITLDIGLRRPLEGLDIVRCRPDQVGMRLLAKLGRSRAMRRALHEKSADVFHTHGLWMMPNVYPARIARREGKPFLLSPHGMLGKEPLAFSASAKRIFWSLWQRDAVHAVDCFHATAESELRDIRQFGLKKPVAIIPNGIDLPDRPDLSGDTKRDSFDESIHPFILSLGRLHPKKGLDRLISAFARVAPAHPRWRLRIVGPDEGGYSNVLARQIDALGLGSSVTIEPPVFDADKFALMWQAEIFALSTLHENFAMTVAESLAAETPVISTRGAPWAGLETNKCGWWIDHGVEPLAAALDKAMTLPQPVRHDMGARGRAWMRRDFGWEGVGEKMAETYSWLQGRQKKPNWVDD
ncbi:MAG: glycosyltransferase [Hyphomicrobiaceae bacterium]